MISALRFAPRPATRSPIDLVQISADGKTIATLDSSLSAWIWDRTSSKPLQQVTLPESLQQRRAYWNIQYSAISFAAEGKSLAVFSNKVSLWDAGTGQLQKAFRPEIGKKRVSMAAFSPDGTLAALNIEDFKEEEIILVDVATGKEVRKLPRTGRGLNLVFSPGGEFLVSNAAKTRTDGGRFVWEVHSGKLLQHYVPNTRAGEGLAVGLAFSPCGLLLAEKNAQSMKVVETGKEVASWGGVVNNIFEPARGHAVAFSPDGRFIAVDNERAVDLWHLETKQKVRVFAGHRGLVRSLAFTPDGKALVTASQDCTALVWDLKSVAVADKVAAPNELWDELKSADRLRAYSAMCRLREMPEKTLALLKMHVQPAAAKQADDLESQRSLWAVKLLEEMNTEPARKILQTLSMGDAASSLTAAANAALRRLEKRGR